MLPATLLLLLGVAGCGGDARDSAASDPVTRWEYRFVGANVEDLRAAGQDGWEAFAMDKAEDGGSLLWLKRPQSEGAR